MIRTTDRVGHARRAAPLPPRRAPAAPAAPSAEDTYEQLLESNLRRRREASPDTAWAGQLAPTADTARAQPARKPASRPTPGTSAEEEHIRLAAEDNLRHRPRNQPPP
jgi:hypothetical protein